jgi:hypothetical protein
MNAQIYALLLTLCPADLKKEFGEEMTQVFLDDLADHQRRCGWMGAARVWWRSLREICGIALPEMASRHGIAVPFMVYVFQMFYISSIIVLARRDPHSAFPKSLGEDLALIFLSGVIPAFIARIAQLVGDASVPVPLRIGP